MARTAAILVGAVFFIIGFLCHLIVAHDAEEEEYIPLRYYFDYWRTLFHAFADFDHPQKWLIRLGLILLLPGAALFLWGWL